MLMKSLKGSLAFLISFSLLVLNSEYSFVASKEGEFISNASKPTEMKTKKDLYIFFKSLNFIKL